MFKLYDIVKPKANMITVAKEQNTCIPSEFRPNWFILVTSNNLDTCNSYSYLLNYCGNAVCMNPHLAKQ